MSLKSCDEERQCRANYGRTSFMTGLYDWALASTTIRGFRDKLETNVESCS